MSPIIRPWVSDPVDRRWFDPAIRLVASALMVFGGLSLVILEYLLAVLWFEGHYERELARQGIVSGSEAPSRAALPAVWVTLVVIAVQAGVAVGLVHLLRRHRRARTPTVPSDP